MSSSTGLLFSSFEPSGDALAAEMIAAVRRRRPELKVYAMGGPKMEAAGAELLELSTHHSTMFFGPLAQAWSHHRRVGRLRRWLRVNPIAAVVPVDSPAANWSICRVVRRTQPAARIVHLVAPQLWAWAPWRIRRLRRLTDRVLCLLPFEQRWLAARGVPASFVGHPAFELPRDRRDELVDGLPAEHPRLALLPGSRKGEVTRNWPTMLEAFGRLKRVHPQLQGVVAALDDPTASLLRELAGASGNGSWPRDLTVVTGRSETVQDWCDLALVASGTVTLQLAARLKPMVIMYNMNRLTVFVARWVVRTRTFTLPNLVSEWAGLGRAVPELVPHHGEVEPIVQHLETVLTNRDAARRQQAMLAEVAARFADRRFTDDAAGHVLAAIS
jgi:lipid-A-disaccharide synthase